MGFISGGRVAEDLRTERVLLVVALSGALASPPRNVLGCDRRTLFRSHDSRGDCVAIPLRAIPRCSIPARLRFVIHSLIADEADDQ